MTPPIGDGSYDHEPDLEWKIEGTTVLFFFVEIFMFRYFLDVFYSPEEEYPEDWYKWSTLSDLVRGLLKKRSPLKTFLVGVQRPMYCPDVSMNASSIP